MRLALAAMLGGAVGCARPAHTEPPAVRRPVPPPTAMVAPTPTEDVVAAASAPAVEASPDVPRSMAGWDRFVPALDAPTRAHVRELFVRGAAAGLRSDVFCKLGDSITESGSFAFDVGHGWYELGAFATLEPVIAWFRRRRLGRAEDDNAFTRASAAATAGWQASQLVEGGDRSPLERELAATRPAFAVLMIGTNEAEREAVAAHASNLDLALDRIERRGVVVLLSTIPPYRASAAGHAAVGAINAHIVATAAARHLPLIDYHAAMARLPSEGISDDGVHPSVFVEGGDTRAAVFTAPGLRFGYNARNLLLLLGLQRVLDAAGVRYATSSR